MIRLLLLNAKCKVMELGGDQSYEVVQTIDTYLRHLDIVMLLVDNNCSDLIPKESISNRWAITKLVELLILEERWTMALEVASKCNLNTSPIWAAWALVCLRAGKWQEARTKFARVLKEPKDRSGIRDESPLLQEILTCLERSSLSLPEPVDALKTMIPDDNNCKYPGSKKEATSIHNALEQLALISSSGFKKQKDCQSVDTQRYEECLFYLKTYGNHHSCLSFLLAKDKVKDAIDYLFEKGCDPQVFLNELFVPCLESGRQETLVNLLTGGEPHDTTHSYLTAACRYLNQQNLLHPLLSLQLSMRDYIRAALTCVYLFGAPVPGRDLAQYGTRLHLLSEARNHLTTYLQLQGYLQRENPTSILHLPSETVKGHLATVQLQLEVVNFLFHNEKVPKPTLPTDLDALPSLFGSNEDRLELVKLIALSSYTIEAGFHLITKIIRLYNLDWEQTIGEIGQQLVTVGRHDEISNLLSCFQSHSPLPSAAACDNVLLHCAKSISPDIPEEVLKKFLQMAKKTSNKALICAMTGRIKMAFILIGEIKTLPELQKVTAYVDAHDLPLLKKICDYVHHKLTTGEDPDEQMSSSSSDEEN